MLHARGWRRHPQAPQAASHPPRGSLVPRGNPSRTAVAAVRRAVVGTVLGTLVVMPRAKHTSADAELVPSSRPAAAHETFSVTYTVTVDAGNPTVARVRWDLSGIDEIERIRLAPQPDRFGTFTASGRLERRHGDLLWWPDGPYGRLTYTVPLNHRRPSGKGFDSYASGNWVVSRTSDLFPRAAALFRPDAETAPESRARLVFRLPDGWQAVTVMPSDAPFSYVVESPGRFDHPRGWLMLGHFRRVDVDAKGLALTVAATPEVTRDLAPIGQLFARALPVLRQLFGRIPSRLLIVTAPDPMWRGGLSGEDSFYIHGARPLRTPDKSSPYLHELFHVAAPFRPAPDAHWITEGLAELYSVEIQRRVGLLDQAGFERALRLMARHGVWGHDFTRSREPALRNNSAPLVLYALDRQIRTATGGARGLDAAVSELAATGGPVSTARFLRSVEAIAGRPLGTFFRRHVYRGERPAVEGLDG